VSVFYTSIVARGLWSLLVSGLGDRSADENGAGSRPARRDCRVLLVDDEPATAAAIVEGLEAEGYAVAHERTGEGAFFRATTESVDVILLDFELPDRNGLEVLSALRRVGLDTPVLVMTGRGSVEDRVAGLNAGADDYVVKPFAVAELLARVRAIVRRVRSTDSSRSPAA
jgi:DNA-binding response OmpR family regulator